ncbi:MAG: hypothetical protein HKN04_09985 [Rhodothermaceae bacterium]|nr:hypothetical protein [Rhodothermaceae bacterium]
MPALAQAWPQQAGHGYLKLAYGTATASEQFSFDGRRRAYAEGVNDDAFFDRSVYAYAEFGLTRQITLVGAIPFRRVFVRDAAFRYRTYGLGSATLAARVGLKPLLGWMSDADALAATVAFTLPTGYTRNRTPSAGAGQVDAEVLLAYGRSFYPAPVYAQLSAGYRHRSAIYVLSQAVPCQNEVDFDCFADEQPDYEDELTASAEIGATIAGRVLVQGLARGVWSVRAPEMAFSVNNPFPTRQRAIKVGGGLRLHLPEDNAGLSVQAFVTPWGRNTIRSVDLFIGLDTTL